MYYFSYIGKQTTPSETAARRVAFIQMVTLQKSIHQLKFKPPLAYS